MSTGGETHSKQGVKHDEVDVYHRHHLEINKNFFIFACHFLNHPNATVTLVYNPAPGVCAVLRIHLINQLTALLNLKCLWKGKILKCAGQGVIPDHGMNL